MSQYLGQYWILVCVFFLCLFLWFVFVDFVWRRSWVHLEVQSVFGCTSSFTSMDELFLHMSMQCYNVGGYPQIAHHRPHVDGFLQHLSIT